MIYLEAIGWGLFWCWKISFWICSFLIVIPTAIIRQILLIKVAGLFGAGSLPKRKDSFSNRFCSAVISSIFCFFSAKSTYQKYET